MAPLQARIGEEQGELALEHALAGSLAAHGPAKNHLDAAANLLHTAIDQGGLDKTAEATKAAEEAISHLQASAKKIKVSCWIIGAVYPPLFFLRVLLACRRSPYGAGRNTGLSV